MRPNILANNYLYLIFVIPIITYLANVSYGLTLRDYADDLYFLTVFNQGGIIDLLSKRYMIWSGRLSIEFVMMHTIGFNLFWRLGIPLAVLISCFSICRIVTKNVSFILFSIIFLLFVLIPGDMNAGSAWWITGFYNYLLPISIALYVYSIAYRSSNKTEKILGILLSFYFPFMEQVGLCFTIALIVLLAVKQKRRLTFNYIILAISSLSTAICVLAPGNFLRTIHETWSWFPQYQFYGTITKIALGLDKLHQAITFKGNIPVIICFFLISLIGFKTNKTSIAVKISTIILTIYTSLLISTWLTDNLIFPNFMSGKTIFSTQWDNMGVALSYMSMLLAITSSFTILISLRNNAEHIAISFIAMLLGYMSIMMMGFSPTVYGSGLRVDYLFEFMFILSCCGLISSLPVFIKNLRVL